MLTRQENHKKKNRQLQATIRTQANRVVQDREEFSLRLANDPYSLLRYIPDNTPISTKKIIISTLIAAGVLFAEFATSPIALPFALLLLSRMTGGTSIPSPIPTGNQVVLNNPYGNNLNRVKIKPPKIPHRECIGVSVLPYKSQKTFVKYTEKLFCFRQVQTPTLNDETLLTAAADAAKIIKDENENEILERRLFKLLALFPTLDDWRLKIAQKAYELVGKPNPYEQHDIVKSQGTITDEPYDTYEISSERLLKELYEDPDTSLNVKLDNIIVLFVQGIPLPKFLPEHEKRLILNGVITYHKDNFSDIITRLLKEGIELNTHYNADNPLIAAVMHKNIIAIEKLLQHGADPLYALDKWDTPLAFALKTEDINIIRPLLECAYFPEVGITRAFKLFIMATESSDLNLQKSIYQIMVDSHQLDIKSTDNQRNNLLHLLIASNEVSFKVKENGINFVEVFAPNLIARKNFKAYNPVALVENNANTHPEFKRLLPKLKQMHTDFINSHPEEFRSFDSPFSYILDVFRPLLYLVLVLSAIYFFIKGMKNIKPLKFTVKGIYTDIHLRALGWNKYAWNLEFKEHESISEHHPKFPGLCPRYLNISLETLQKDIETFLFFNDGKGIYYCSQDVAVMKQSLSSALFSFERAQIEKTPEFKSSNPRGITSNRLEKVDTIRNIVDNFLFFLEQIQQYENQNFSLPKIYVESETIQSIRTEIAVINQEQQQNLTEYKQAFLNITPLFEEVFKESNSDDFKLTCNQLWGKLENIGLKSSTNINSVKPLEVIRTEISAISQLRNNYILQIERTVKRLQEALAREVVMLKKAGKHQNNSLDDGVVILVPGEKRKDYPKVFANNPSPKPSATKSTTVVRTTKKSLIGSLVPTSISSFFSKKTKELESIRLQPSRLSNNELLPYINEHLASIDKRLAIYESTKKEPSCALVYRKAIQYHLFQLSHCCVLSRKKKDEEQFAVKNKSDITLRTILAHSSYMIQNEALESARCLGSDYGNKLTKGVLISFTETSLYKKADELSPNCEPTLDEIKRWLIKVINDLDLIDTCPKELLWEEIHREEAFKIVLMEFNELNSTLYRNYHRRWTQGLLEKITHFKDIDTQLQSIVNIRHPHDARTPPVTSEKVLTLAARLLELKRNRNLIAIIDDIDKQQSANISDLVERNARAVRP